MNNGGPASDGTLKRVIAGDLNTTYTEKLGFDTRGLIDLGPMYRIRRLKEIAQRKGEKKALMILNRLEKYQYIIQSNKIPGMVREDLTKVALIGGNRDDSEMVNDDPLDKMLR